MSSSVSNYVPKIKTLNILYGIFLLIMAVSGNFVAETLSCQTQRLLSSNMYAKNIVVLMIIYFTLGFTDESAHPLVLARQTILIWVFFLIFNKMHIKYSVLTLGMLFFVLILKNVADYYSNYNGYGYFNSILTKNVKIFFLITCIIVLYGFIKYFIEKKQEYKDEFSYKYFIFGKQSCKTQEKEKEKENEQKMKEIFNKEIKNFIKNNKCKINLKSRKNNKITKK